MIEIDGSLGGGQMLRTAISLSALTGKGVKIRDIRKGKPNTKPGLRPQHMTGINIIGEFCNAEILGLKENSLEVEFRPWEISAKDKKIDIGTAGSITLLLQALLPILIFSKKEIKLHIKGGTDVSWSPTVNYTKFVFLPMLRKMGVNAELEIINHGFYPKGGGEVKVITYPVKNIKPITALQPGNILGLHIESVVSRYPKDYTERMVKAALSVLDYSFPGKKVSIGLKTVNSESYGSSILCYANCENSILGVDMLGDAGTKPETLGIRVAEELDVLIKKNVAIDKFMADQLLLYMALADGKSLINVERITEHCLTNIYVIEKMLPVKFQIDERKGLVSVEGIGFSR